jgi:Papain family cysteine protease
MVSVLLSVVYSYTSLLQRLHVPPSYNAMTDYGNGCRAFEHIFSQGDCSACGAFAVASVYGMRSCKNGGNDFPSPYRIFDCGNGDCEVGMSLYNLVVSIKNGVTDLAKSPAVYGWGCPSGGGALKISTLFPLMLAPLIKRDILANGPVLALVSGSDEYKDYMTGVYSDGIGLSGDHLVAVLGWGAATDTEPEHWIIQNSWSTDWGEGGRGKHAMSFFDQVYSVYRSVYR